nr:uncharacterized protein CI109_004614 [Kwoniella shandongensis]KAA5527079.1 hypothetical protein CI109_004614 [Kwoniella shandongensis]
MAIPKPPSSSPPPPPLPTLPFEIQRRIIHFRLALDSSYPSYIGEADEPSPSWDVWAGVKGRNSACKRVEERKDVGRTAKGLMGVCKAWKGRLPFPHEEIGYSAFARHLKCLEGVEVDREVDPRGRDGLVQLLRRLPSLEVLGVLGPGGDVLLLDDESAPILRLSKLHTLKLDGVICGRLMTALIRAELPSLRRLLLTPHYLHIMDQTYALQETHGDKIVSLTYLPSNSWPPRSTLEGQAVNAPAEQTLSLHPNLRHLSFLLQEKDSMDQLDIILRLASSMGHPLKVLTIPKWTDPPSTSSAAADGISATGLFTNHQIHTTTTTDAMTTSHQLLDTLVQRPPPKLKRVNVDGFKWVKAELGKVAMTAGKSGEMRMWAGVLSRNGIELGDMDGGLAPPMSVGGVGGMGTIGSNRRRSSGGAGMARMSLGMGMGMAGGVKSPRDGSGSPPRSSGREDEDGG